MPGYTCDVSAGTCDRADTQSELTELAVGNVPCGDGSSCPSGTTCCKLSSGQWGCCPYPEAVCCDDGEHCCPSGLIIFQIYCPFLLVFMLKGMDLKAKP